MLVKVVRTLILGMVFIAVSVEILEVFAQVDETQVENLINQKFEELDRRDKVFGWILGISGLIATAVSIFVTIKFRRVWNIDKTLVELRADIQHLYRWCQNLDKRIESFRTFQTVTILLFCIYGAILLIFIGYMTLR